MTRQDRIYCLKASSDYHSEVCEECRFYTNCDHTIQDDITELTIKDLEALEQESILDKIRQPKIGHWIQQEDGTYKCSNCKKYELWEGIYCASCGAKMETDEKRFCSRCGWNDCDYGCICPSDEKVYQCDMYMYYHPEEVEAFKKDMEEWAKQKTESEEK